MHVRQALYHVANSPYPPHAIFVVVFKMTSEKFILLLFFGIIKISHAYLEYFLPQI
jgi:hypothetical protein